MKSLCRIQLEAIERLHEPRTSERRHTKWRRAVYTKFISEARRLGYTKDMDLILWKDVLDMWNLERDSEDA